MVFHTLLISVLHIGVFSFQFIIGQLRLSPVFQHLNHNDAIIHICTSVVGTMILSQHSVLTNLSAEQMCGRVVIIGVTPLMTVGHFLHKSEELFLQSFLLAAAWLPWQPGQACAIGRALLVPSNSGLSDSTTACSPGKQLLADMVVCLHCHYWSMVCS